MFANLLPFLSVEQFMSTGWGCIRVEMPSWREVVEMVKQPSGSMAEVHARLDVMLISGSLLTTLVVQVPVTIPTLKQMIKDHLKEEPVCSVSHGLRWQSLT